MNERVSALDSGAVLVSETTPQPQSNSDITFHVRSPSLERLPLSRVRDTSGAVSRRKVVTRWVTVCEGRIAKGKFPVSLQTAHINFLELLTVFLAVKHFVQLLRHHHVLVRLDNTTAVAYINRQGGTRSPQLHSLAQKLILWRAKHFH